MHTTESEHRDTLEARAQALARDCYQCGKCSAGCPMAAEMDLLPNQLIRLVQLDRLERAMKSGAIWQCVSCLTCSTRCPKSVDCAGVMDTLRQMSFEHDCVASAYRRTVLFQKAFLDNVRRNGRVDELQLVGEFKARTFWTEWSVPFLFKDAMLGPRMLQRGKLHLRGERVKDRGVVQRIFARCQNGTSQPRETAD